MLCYSLVCALWVVASGTMTVDRQVYDVRPESGLVVRAQTSQSAEILKYVTLRYRSPWTMTFTDAVVKAPGRTLIRPHLFERLEAMTVDAAAGTIVIGMTALQSVHTGLYQLITGTDVANFFINVHEYMPFDTPFYHTGCVGDDYPVIVKMSQEQLTITECKQWASDLLSSVEKPVRMIRYIASPAENRPKTIVGEHWSGKGLRLVLPNVSPADAGMYQCRVKDHSGKEGLVSFNLAVHSAFKIDRRPPRVAAEEGGSATLRWSFTAAVPSQVLCSTVDFEPLDVLELENGGQRDAFTDPSLLPRLAWVPAQPPGQVEFTLAELIPEDATLYRCTIALRGEVSTAHRQLIVTPRHAPFAAEESYYQGELDEAVTMRWIVPEALGADAVISCSKTTNKRPQFFLVIEEQEETITKQAKQFRGRVEWHRNEIQNNVLEVTIRELKWKDSGTYRCSYQTPLGTSASECTLYVEDHGERSKKILAIIAGAGGALVLFIVGATLLILWKKGELVCGPRVDSML